MRGGRTGVLLLAALLAGCAAAPAPTPTMRLPTVEVQPPAPAGRAVIEGLAFSPLEFSPPVPERVTLASGATLFYLEDASLPLVDLQVRFRGGPSHFSREVYGAAVALAGLLRSGGTERLPPDSLDELVDHHAWSMTFGSGGRTSFGGFSSLARTFEPGLRLFAEMITRPRFDAARVEVWRGQELEVVRRRKDNPGFFAASEFNRLMYGDHPVGWIVEEEDLGPEQLTEATLRRLHGAIYCPGNAIFGLTGALPLEEARRLLDGAFEGWAPCAGELMEPPPPDVRDAGGIFVIPRPLTQSTVYMAHGSELRQSDHPDYYASRVANAILGGSGFSSRLVREVRSERGLAYGAGSFWTTPRRDEGVFGATTSTRTGTTVEAIRVMRQVMDDMRAAPPAEDEVRVAVEDAVNGFVFNFDDPAQIVGRQMLYHHEGLPPDWLERYLEGIQSVSPGDVHRVILEHVHPERLTILILGDIGAMDPPPTVLGEVAELRVESPRTPGEGGL